jgi:hypothetical protein
VEDVLSSLFANGPRPGPSNLVTSTQAVRKTAWCFIFYFLLVKEIYVCMWSGEKIKSSEGFIMKNARTSVTFDHCVLTWLLPLLFVLESNGI